jgi:hypothetical protein
MNALHPLSAIAERVEIVAGVDRDLDIEVALALPSWTYGGGPMRFFNAGPYYEGAADRIGLQSIHGGERPIVPGQAPDMLVPKFTESVDVAKRVMPAGWFVRITEVRFGMWRCEAWRGDKSVKTPADASAIAPSEERCRLACGLRALATGAGK